MKREEVEIGLRDCQRDRQEALQQVGTFVVCRDEQRKGSSGYLFLTTGAHKNRASVIGRADGGLRRAPIEQS